MLDKAVVEQSLQNNQQVYQSSRAGLDFELRFHKISSTRTTAARASIPDTLLSRILVILLSCPCNQSTDRLSSLCFVFDYRRCMIESMMSNLSIARRLDNPYRCMSRFRPTFQILDSPSDPLSSNIVFLNEIRRRKTENNLTNFPIQGKQGSLSKNMFPFQFLVHHSQTVFQMSNFAILFFLLRLRMILNSLKNRTNLRKTQFA